MHTYQIIVAFRKEKGPEWIPHTFIAEIEDLDTYVTEEELQEWAKDDVRNRIETEKQYSTLGKDWVISEVVKK